MNEIEIKQYQLPKLEIKDYQLIKETVEHANEKYKKYIVTSETLDADIKKRAELRNYAKIIDDKRKKIEKEISSPIKQFKLDCDFLKNMYEASANLLDKQIKVFENKSKQAKKQEIQNIFNELVGKEAISELINLNMLFDERYLNKTYKLEDVEKDLVEKIRKIVNELEAIKNLKSDNELALTNLYLKEFDLTKVINENNRLEELKKTTQKVEEKKEEIKQEEIEQMLIEEVKTESIDPIKEYTLKITAPLSKQQALRKFLELNEMKFERID